MKTYTDDELRHLVIHITNKMLPGEYAVAIAHVLEVSP